MLLERCIGPGSYQSIYSSNPRQITMVIEHVISIAHDVWYGGSRSSYNVSY